MKKAFVLVFVFIALSLSSALALEVSGPNTVRPFRSETFSVDLPSPGTVTVTAEVFQGIPKMTIVPETHVPAGAFSFEWNGLYANSEPAVKDSHTLLEVSFTADSGIRDSGAMRIKISNPLSIVIFAQPRAAAFFPGDGPFGVDYLCSADNTTVVIEVASENAPGSPVASYTAVGMSQAQGWFWNARNNKGVFVVPGRYVISFYARANPEYRSSFTVTVSDKPVPAPPLKETETWQPSGFESDAVTWAMLQEPVAVLKGADGNGYKVREKPSSQSAVVGTVSCAQTALRVLGGTEDDYVRVGFFRREDARYAEGYVSRADLMTMYPSAEYGLVLDKRIQVMHVYFRGAYQGSLDVSTGLKQVNASECLTRAGIYLTGDFLKNFMRDGYWYNYPIRIDGPNLIHTAGMKRDMGGTADYTDQVAELGQRASHGCVRVDPRAQEGTGLNWYYLYTHIARYTKIIVIENDLEHIPGWESGEFEVGE